MARVDAGILHAQRQTLHVEDVRLVVCGVSPQAFADAAGMAIVSIASPKPAAEPVPRVRRPSNSMSPAVNSPPLAHMPGDVMIPPSPGRASQSNSVKSVNLTGSTSSKRKCQKGFKKKKRKKIIFYVFTTKQKQLIIDHSADEKSSFGWQKAARQACQRAR